MLAKDIRAKAIVAFTRSGFTAELISSLRPETPIIAYTNTEEVRRQLTLYWGVTALAERFGRTTDSIVTRVQARLLEQRFASVGDTVVVLGCGPVGLMAVLCAVGRAGRVIGVDGVPARRVLAAGILRVDPHQVAYAHLARLETLAEREHVAHAGCGREGLGRDRTLAGRDTLAEGDLGLAREEGRASDPAQVSALGVGDRGRPAGRVGRLGR